MSETYMLLKPEVRNHLSQLDHSLRESAFRVTSRHPVPDWESLSRRIYSFQIDMTEKFSYEFNAYVWLTRHFFGNSSVIFVLEDDFPNIQDSLNNLTKFKSEFRQQMYATGDNAIRIFLDFRYMITEGASNLGRNGFLGVDTGPNADRFEGRWDNYYFKYIHCSDSNPDTFRREWAILAKNKVFGSKINENEWDVMKRLQILAAPRF